MKNSTIFIFIFFIIKLSAFSDNETINVLLNKEGNENFRNEREKWINDMHLVPDGVDWKLIELENRTAKNSYKQKLIHKLIAENKTDELQNQNSIFAGGRIRGKWIERGSDNLAGRIHTADIDFNRKLIYAASSGGNIWRGTINGENWACLNNNFQIGNIRLVRILKIGTINRILVVGNSPAGVYYSDNEGLTWEKSLGLKGPENWGWFTRAVVANDGYNTIYVLGSEWDYKNWKSVVSVYYSKDYGLSFKEVTKMEININHCDIWAPRYDGDKVYFIHADSLSTLTDSVKTYIGPVNIKNQFLNINKILLTGNNISGKDNLLIYINDRKDNLTYFNLTTDLGQSWQELSKTETSAFEQNSFAVSTNDINNFFLGGVDLYKFKPDSSFMKKLNHWGDYYGNIEELLHADIPGICFFRNPDGGEICLICTDGGIYISYDGNKTFKNLSLKGLNVSQYYSTYTHRWREGVSYAGSQDQGFQRSLEKGDSVLNFVQTISGDYGHLSSSDDGDHIWCVYPGFAMLYRAAHESNMKMVTWTFRGTNWLWIPPCISDPANPDNAYLASGGFKLNDTITTSQIWRLRFNGTTGFYSDTLPFNFNKPNQNIKVSSIAFSPLNSNYLYAANSNGTFYVSTDVGNTWKETPVFDGPDAHYFYGNSIVPSKSKFGRIYVAGSGYSAPGVSISEDNGLTFSRLDSNLPKTMIYDIDVTEDDKFIFAATDAGPYIYSTDDSVWYDLSGLVAPDQTYWTVEYIPNMKTARFGTYGRGIWDFKIEEILSAGKSNHEIILSGEINIKVQPNPVDNRSNIIIGTNEIGLLSLKIYNTAGIPVFVKETEKFNIHDYEINLIDFYESVPSGNFLAVISINGKSNWVQLKVMK